MADDQYLDLGLTAQANPDTIRDATLDRIAENMPEGWQAPEGSLIWLDADATAEVAAEREQQTIDVAREIFAAFGETVHGVAMGHGQAATGFTTWTITSVPVDGGLIPAQTQVARGDVLFETTVDTYVPTPTATVTDVAIVAVEPGTAGNVDAGSVDVLSSFPFAATAEIAAPGTDGGEDAEDPDAYLNRLRLHVAHAGRPVLPDDYAARLRDLFPTAARVLAIDLYDAGTATSGVEKHVTLVPVDEDGEALPSGTRTSAAALLDAEREANFVVHVIAPTYTTVNASATITVWPGWDSTDVHDRAVAAVQVWLDPAAWGQPPNVVSAEWHDEPTVLRSELSAVLNSVEGVRHVTVPKLGTSSPADADVSLTGPGALTRPGTVTITVS